MAQKLTQSVEVSETPKDRDDSDSKQKKQLLAVSGRSKIMSFFQTCQLVFMFYSMYCKTAIMFHYVIVGFLSLMQLFSVRNSFSISVVLQNDWSSVKWSNEKLKCIESQMLFYRRSLGEAEGPVDGCCKYFQESWSALETSSYLCSSKHLLDEKVRWTGNRGWFQLLFNKFIHLCPTMRTLFIQRWPKLLKH